MNRLFLIFAFVSILFNFLIVPSSQALLPDSARHLISKITVNDQLVSLYVLPDAMVNSYYVNLVLGPYDAPSPTAICTVVFTDIDRQKSPSDAVTKVVTKINATLTEYFGPPTPLPPNASWQEQFEMMVDALLLYMQGNVPQVK